MPERRQSKRHSKSPYNTRDFSSPVSRAVSPPSLSPEGSDAPTDRVLTFLQSARDRNVPVRFGKWSKAEELYLEKLISLFKGGLLDDIQTSMSLRSFLALMLNCCPMRISKKQMHGHNFVGKTKYTPHKHKMTQEQYDELCNEIWTLRDDFLKAWAKEEYARRSSKFNHDDVSFEGWYDKIVAQVPTPKITMRPSFKECKKRGIESLGEVKTQVQSAKRQEIEQAAKMRPEADQEHEEEPEQKESPTKPLEPEKILLLEPAPLLTPTETAVVALPTAFCSDTLTLGDWMTESDRGCAAAQWTDFQTMSHVGEARYTFCEDQVQVSVHLADQQTSTAELSMTRKSSRLVIDFGAPSNWHSDEETKPLPYSDYLQWTDNDLAGDSSLPTGLFDWDDFAHLRHSPTLNYL
ncbi:hypothetical protein P3T76_009418 [Phytophthora citrophthora]|uniref:Uncharacterized protein n=1 Tax=Phytophthora citrophthora TaxID=4793 RepID=A0AAD9GHF0_9STRA|nr:hypothetical protein P3T76_009418 [Phytophthora citrophthora]